MGTLLLGTGNEICGDDGIAAAIIREITKNPLPRDIRITFIGTDPFSVLNQELMDFRRIIVIDGINTGGSCGDSYFIPGEKLMFRERPYSIHDITWLEVLAMAGVLSKTWLFAVETDTLNFGEGLSPVLRGKLRLYAAKLRRLISTF